MLGVTGVFAASLLTAFVLLVRLQGEGDEHRRVAIALPCMYCDLDVLPWSWVSSEPREVDVGEKR